MIVTHDIADTSLTLSNVRRAQHGLYQCFASNQVGTAHAFISLNVLPAADTHFASGTFLYYAAIPINSIPVFVHLSVLSVCLTPMQAPVFSLDKKKAQEISANVSQGKK